MMYGFGATEIAIRKAERTINDLIRLCKNNNGNVYLSLDNGTFLCLTDNVHLSYYTAIETRNEQE